MDDDEDLENEAGFGDEIDTTGADADAANRPRVELQVLEEITITKKAKISKVQVMAGKKKTVKLELIISYDTEDTSALNDSLGEYVDLQMDRKIYKQETPEEMDELNQLKLEFEEEIGA